MTCILCERQALNAGRGLCRACHMRLARHGELLDFPRATTPRDEVLSEWLMHADRSLSQSENVRLLAPRMGMSEHALEQAIRRLKNSGLLNWRSAA